jgi:hypothetical protein
MDNNEDIENIRSSILDKTDWRSTIHKLLEACIYAKGTEYYPKRVKALIAGFGTTYPGWDAKKALDNKIKELEHKYTVEWDIWKGEHSTARRWKKYLKEKELRTKLFDDIFTYVLDTTASRRMLLWGSSKTPGGSEMEDQ